MDGDALLSDSEDSTDTVLVSGARRQLWQTCQALCQPLDKRAKVDSWLNMADENGNRLAVSAAQRGSLFAAPAGETPSPAPGPHGSHGSQSSRRAPDTDGKKRVHSASGNDLRADRKRLRLGNVQSRSRWAPGREQGAQSGDTHAANGGASSARRRGHASTKRRRRSGKTGAPDDRVSSQQGDSSSASGRDEVRDRKPHRARVSRERGWEKGTLCEERGPRRRISGESWDCQSSASFRGGLSHSDRRFGAWRHESFTAPSEKSERKRLSSGRMSGSSSSSSEISVPSQIVKSEAPQEEQNWQDSTTRRIKDYSASPKSGERGGAVVSRYAMSSDSKHTTEENKGGENAQMTASGSGRDSLKRKNNPTGTTKSSKRVGGSSCLQAAKTLPAKTSTHAGSKAPDNSPPLRVEYHTLPERKQKSAFKSLGSKSSRLEDESSEGGSTKKEMRLSSASRDKENTPSLIKISKPTNRTSNEDSCSSMASYLGSDGRTEPCQALPRSETSAPVRTVAGTVDTNEERLANPMADQISQPLTRTPSMSPNSVSKSTETFSDADLGDSDMDNFEELLKDINRDISEGKYSNLKSSPPSSPASGLVTIKTEPPDDPVLLSPVASPGLSQPGSHGGELGPELSATGLFEADPPVICPRRQTDAPSEWARAPAAGAPARERANPASEGAAMSLRSPADRQLAISLTDELQLCSRSLLGSGPADRLSPVSSDDCYTNSFSSTSQVVEKEAKVVPPPLYSPISSDGDEPESVRVSASARSVQRDPERELVPSGDLASPPSGAPAAAAGAPVGQKRTSHEAFDEQEPTRQVTPDVEAVGDRRSSGTADDAPSVSRQSPPPPLQSPPATCPLSSAVTSHATSSLDGPSDEDALAARFAEIERQLTLVSDAAPSVTEFAGARDILESVRELVELTARGRDADTAAFLGTCAIAVRGILCAACEVLGAGTPEDVAPETPVSIPRIPDGSAAGETVVTSDTTKHQPNRKKTKAQRRAEKKRLEQQRFQVPVTDEPQERVDWSKLTEDIPAEGDLLKDAFGDDYLRSLSMHAGRLMVETALRRLSPVYLNIRHTSGRLRELFPRQLSRAPLTQGSRKWRVRVFELFQQHCLADKISPSWIKRELISGFSYLWKPMQSKRENLRVKAHCEMLPLNPFCINLRHPAPPSDLRAARVTGEQAEPEGQIKDQSADLLKQHHGGLRGGKPAHQSDHVSGGDAADIPACPDPGVADCGTPLGSCLVLPRHPPSGPTCHRSAASSANCLSICPSTCSPSPPNHPQPPPPSLAPSSPSYVTPSCHMLPSTHSQVSEPPPSRPPLLSVSESPSHPRLSPVSRASGCPISLLGCVSSRAPELPSHVPEPPFSVVAKASLGRVSEPPLDESEQGDSVRLEGAPEHLSEPLSHAPDHPSWTVESSDPISESSPIHTPELPISFRKGLAFPDSCPSELSPNTVSCIPPVSRPGAPVSTVSASPAVSGDPTVAGARHPEPGPTRRGGDLAHRPESEPGPGSEQNPGNDDIRRRTLEAELEMDLEPEPEPEPEPVPVPEPEPEPERALEPELEPELKPELEPEPKPELELEPKPEPEPELKVVPEVDDDQEAEEPESELPGKLLSVSGVDQGVELKSKMKLISMQELAGELKGTDSLEDGEIVSRPVACRGTGLRTGRSPAAVASDLDSESGSESLEEGEIISSGEMSDESSARRRSPARESGRHRRRGRSPETWGRLYRPHSQHPGRSPSPPWPPVCQCISGMRLKEHWSPTKKSCPFHHMAKRRKSLKLPSSSTVPTALDARDVSPELEPSQPFPMPNSHRGERLRLKASRCASTAVEDAEPVSSSDSEDGQTSVARPEAAAVATASPPPPESAGDAAAAAAAAHVGSVGPSPPETSAGRHVFDVELMKKRFEAFQRRRQLITPALDVALSDALELAEDASGPRRDPGREQADAAASPPPPSGRQSCVGTTAPVPATERDTSGPAVSDGITEPAGHVVVTRPVAAGGTSHDRPPCGDRDRDSGAAEPASLETDPPSADSDSEPEVLEVQVLEDTSDPEVDPVEPHPATAALVSPSEGADADGRRSRPSTGVKIESRVEAATPADTRGIALRSLSYTADSPPTTLCSIVGEVFCGRAAPLHRTGTTLATGGVGQRGQLGPRPAAGETVRPGQAADSADQQSLAAAPVNNQSRVPGVANEQSQLAARVGELSRETAIADEPDQLPVLGGKPGQEVGPVEEPGRRADPGGKLNQAAGKPNQQTGLADRPIQTTAGADKPNQKTTLADSLNQLAGPAREPSQETVFVDKLNQVAPIPDKQNQVAALADAARDQKIPAHEPKQVAATADNSGLTSLPADKCGSAAASAQDFSSMTVTNARSGPAPRADAVRHEPVSTVGRRPSAAVSPHSSSPAVRGSGNDVHTAPLSMDAGRDPSDKPPSPDVDSGAVDLAVAGGDSSGSMAPGSGVDLDLVLDTWGEPDGVDNASAGSADGSAAMLPSWAPTSPDESALPAADGGTPPRPRPGRGGDRDEAPLAMSIPALINRKEAHRDRQRCRRADAAARPSRCQFCGASVTKLRAHEISCAARAGQGRAEQPAGGCPSPERGRRESTSLPRSRRLPLGGVCNRCNQTVPIYAEHNRSCPGRGPRRHTGGGGRCMHCGEDVSDFTVHNRVCRGRGRRAAVVGSQQAPSSSWRSLAAPERPCVYCGDVVGDLQAHSAVCSEQRRGRPTTGSSPHPPSGAEKRCGLCRKMVFGRFAAHNPHCRARDRRHAHPSGR